MGIKKTKMFKMSQSEKRIRQRGKNFSPTEEVTLLQLLKPYKHIIDNKRSDAFSCQMKKDAWEQLAQEFTIQTGMPRTWRTLKDKYKNMNTKLKAEGKRMDQPLIQSDECETAASSCVSVVYENSDEEDSELNNSQNNEGEDNEVQMINNPETIEKDSMLEEVQMESPVATNLKHLSSPVQDKLPINYLQRSLDAEKRVLVRLQQRFIQNENARASKRHRLELKSINLKNQLLELELEERRKRIKGDKENTIVLS